MLKFLIIFRIAVRIRASFLDSHIDYFFKRSREKKICQIERGGSKRFEPFGYLVTFSLMNMARIFHKTTSSTSFWSS